MRVLVACEYSGIVRDAFTARGHYAMSCDLLPTESPGAHYQGDVMDIINDGWDMMIGHPPCTYMSHAGAKHLYPGGKINKERLAKAMGGKEFFMKLWNAPIDKICLENPMPSPIVGLPPCTQMVQPYYFGDPFMKKTLLWLKNLQPLVYMESGEKPPSTKVAGNWFNKGGKDRQKNRARFWPSIAREMAQQWG